MTAFLSALAGALSRLVYGGAFKYLPSQVANLMFFATGVAFLLPADIETWRALIVPVAVSFAATLGFNPGHGSYVDAGASPKLDNEDVRPIVRLVAALFGARDAQSVAYDSIGAGVRYGLATLVTQLVMWGANTWGGAAFAGWYWSVGFGASLVLYLLSRICRGQLLWRAFEAAVGALIFGALPLTL